MTTPGRPVVLVTGAPGTGKSTLGRMLAARLGAALVDLDVATWPMVEVVQALLGEDDLDGGRLRELTRTARYEVVAALAVDSLQAGVPVILVAPYTTERADEQAWATLRHRLVRAGGAPLLVWLALPAAEAARRMRQRGASRDRHTLSRPEPPAQDIAPPTVPHLRLAADRPVETMADVVVAALDPHRS